MHSEVIYLFKCYDSLQIFAKKAGKAGVDAMLLRCYDPILWRALAATNAAVSLLKIN
jgi:hypothetical protein